MSSNIVQTMLDNPPPDVYRPLRIFDEYISSLSIDSGTIQSLAVTTEEQRHEEILRTANSLFGKTLEGALKLLDQSSSHITRVISLHSNRYAYFVKASSESSSYQPAGTEQYYTCVIPDKADERNENNKGYYCSCPAFRDRNRTIKDESTICKHLLALKLMPLLGITCAQLEMPNEHDFATLVAQRSGFTQTMQID
jgi:hypothetical protein